MAVADTNTVIDKMYAVANVLAASALLRLYLDEEGVLQAVVEPYIVTTRGSAAAASSKASSSPAASDASDEPAADDGASSREAGTSLAVAGDSDPTALARAIVGEFVHAALDEIQCGVHTAAGLCVCCVVICPHNCIVFYF